MNPGGEPERDDTGLPPVDIEIPDDARELDRDVQAYYREQRAVRRQQRRSRLHGFLAKDGIVLPLLACCLILALITGTLLTVFTAASDRGFSGLYGAGGQPGTTGKATGGPRTGAPSTGATRGGATRAGAASPTAPARASTAAGARTPARPVAARPSALRLPPAAVQVGGRSVGLRSLHRAVLVLLPPKCTSCRAAVANLAQFATAAGARSYLVSSPGQRPAATQLARQVNAQHHGRITVAVDSRNAVSPDRAAAIARNLVAGENLRRLRPALTG